MLPFDILARASAHLGIPSGTHGNVVVLPGILETDLKDQTGDSLWIFPPAFERLKLAPDGIHEDIQGRIVTTDGANFVCAPIIGVLQQSWNVLVVGYDWRKDLNATASTVADQIRRHFDGAPFHIVAHSMGGLVGRLIRAHFPGIQRGGRFVMIGTPNHGSYLAVKALTADDAASSFLSLFGIFVPPAPAMAAARTWPGAYQLLPCPHTDPSALPFYQNPQPGLSSEHLRGAARLHSQLDAAPIGADAYCIVGSQIPTFDGGDVPTLEGDGVVSHRLGLLAGAKTFKVFGDHVALPSHPLVLTSITSLLKTGKAPFLG